MWKDYSWGYIKNNRASGISVIVAAFISALLLSLLSSLFYNLWAYEIERLKREEGDWQSRITGIFQEEDLITIQNFANVDNVVFNQELSNAQEMVIDVSWRDMRTIFQDMPQVAKLLEIEPEAVTYHYKLLAMYLIRSPQDTAPRLIFPFLLIVTVLGCFSLVMIIHNSFAVTMNARVHQFGIFSSIGATPAQIRICLLQEAAALCAIPIFVGNVFGLLISKVIIEGTNILLTDTSGRMDAIWEYHPLIFVVTFIITAITIWTSAWIPAWKLSRLSPLEAIQNIGELQLSKRKRTYLLPRLFGIEGELATNALRAQRKALRTATFALTISFLAFALMQCFFTLTRISQRLTYFDRYQDVWDIMITVKDTQIDDFLQADMEACLKKISEVQDGAIYQKAEAKCKITKEALSKEMNTEHGLYTTSGLQKQVDPDKIDSNAAWLVNAPVIILDNTSFLRYCEQIGAEQRLDGAVILNRFNNNSTSNFRVRNDIPYLKENQETTVLYCMETEDISVEIPVISYTQEVPVLREAYDTLDRYVLVHILSVSVWKEIKDQIGGAQPDTYIRVLAGKGVTLAALKELETEILQHINPAFQVESENRIQKKRANDEMINGMMLITGVFCVLLAFIGIGNVFSNTLGFVYQRKREFARYLSVGLEPEGIGKIFCIEAFVLVGRPIIIVIPLTVGITALMIKLSYLDPIIFLREAPVLPITAFLAAVFGIVAAAYYLGGRKVMKSSLAASLRDGTML